MKRGKRVHVVSDCWFLLLYSSRGKKQPSISFFILETFTDLFLCLGDRSRMGGRVCSACLTGLPQFRSTVTSLNLVTLIYPGVIPIARAALAREEEGGESGRL